MPGETSLSCYMKNRLVRNSCLIDGTGKLILTGKLGDVMQESAPADVSNVRSHYRKLEPEENFYRNNDFYIHVP